MGGDAGPDRGIYAAGARRNRAARALVPRGVDRAAAVAPPKSVELSVAYLADARALSRMLLGPVAAYLTRPRVLIVSDGILHLLPFSALPDPRTIASDTQDADPLILEHELIHLPSASTLAFAQRKLEPGQTLAEGGQSLRRPDLRSR